MEIIAFANHKGGVGKTALTFNLAAILAGRDWRVLTVDIDPQSSLTAAFGVSAAGASLADVLGSARPGRRKLPDVIRHVGYNLALAPADISLSENVLGLVNRLGREAVLKTVLADVANTYDLILIDCPPSLDLLTINALAAATRAGGVIIPTRPEVTDLRGVQLFVESVHQVRDAINPDLRIMGIVPTFYNPRLLHHQAGLDGLAASGLPVTEAKIGQSIRISECLAAGEPLTLYERNNPQTENFVELAKWIENHVKT